MTETKDKRYVSDNAQLMAEWNWGKNEKNGLDPHKLTCGSNKKVWWMCNQKHEWDAKICNRTNGSGCPFCTGRYVSNGKNDLQTLNPVLASEWNYEKNDKLVPTNIQANSGKKVWWKCKNGHEWQARIDSRNKGHGCPYCSGRYAIEGVNDLCSTNHTLLQEWNYKRNGALRPESFLANSDQKVWWICRKGHEWEGRIGHRSNGVGCPYCSGLYVTKGENDLQTKKPNLACEWNYKKNKNLTPDEFLPNSNKLVWWICKKGHEWSATIDSRNRGRGCPVCNSERNTSFPEYAIVFYLKRYNLDVVHSYKENGYELDVYIPSKKIGIEYDGFYWHQNRKKQDLDKNRKCKNDGIKLYRLREGLPPLNDSSNDFVVQKDYKALDKTLEIVLGEIVGITIDIDLERDTIAIENLRDHTEKENSILYLYPQVASEWNQQKNGGIKAENYTASSHKKVWWKCVRGHEWQATIDNRTKGYGCPYCSGRYAISGENDLQTTNRVLASEWNVCKNGKLTPADVMPNSHRTVWWKCNKGHEWQARIADRNRGRGCPECAKINRKNIKL